MTDLICLGGGVESVPILARLAAEHRLTVVDGAADAPGFEFAHRPVVASCYHADAAIRGLLTAGGVYDGVLCCAIDAPHVAAAVAEHFNLPGLRPAAAELSVDKLAQIEVLDGAGVPVPAYGAGEPTLQAGVIKPVRSRGARGVTRLLDGVNVDAAIAQARACSADGRAMWEEWLDGPQYSTESVVEGGRVIWTGAGLRNYARLAEFAPAVVEDGYDSLPAPGLASELSLTIERAVMALGWDNCTVKGDLVLHNGVWTVIELAARLAGGYFAAPGHQMAYGVDFAGAAGSLALGRPAGVLRGSHHPVSQRYIFGQPGRAIRALPPFPPGVFGRWHKAAGYRCGATRSHADRLGMVMISGPQARDRAARIAADLAAGVVYD